MATLINALFATSAALREKRVVRAETQRSQMRDEL